MSIPDFQAAMLPLLKAIANGKDHLMRDVTRQVADTFNLTEEERRQLLPSGQQTVISNRVAWAKTHMKMAGLLENPTRGTIRISELGRKVLDARPDRVDMKLLRDFPG